MTSKNVILIWENIPESTEVFLLKDLTEEEFDIVSKCHGMIINVNNDGTFPDKDLAVDKVNLYLTPEKYKDSSYSDEVLTEVGVTKEEVSKWDKFKITHGDLIPVEGYDLLVVSGFYM